MSSYDQGRERPYLLIVLLTFLLQSPLMAQDHVDTYFLKTELVPEGNKITYIAADEIDSSEPKQFVIMNRDTMNEAAFDANERSDEALSSTRNGLLRVHAPYFIDSVKIIDKTGNIIIEKREINNHAFNVDLITLKSGFYTLKIISNTKRLRDAG